jgi:hypothetical protein
MVALEESAVSYERGPLHVEKIHEPESSVLARGRAGEGGGEKRVISHNLLVRIHFIIEMT